MRNPNSHAQDFDFHLEGLELVEDPDGLRVGAHFAKPVPPRKGKPGLWQRFVSWWNQPGISKESEEWMSWIESQKRNTPFL